MKLLSVSIVLLSCFALNADARSVRFAPVIDQPLNADIIPGEYIVMLREPEAGMYQNNDYSAYVDAHLNSLFGESLMNQHRVIHKYNLGYAAKLEHDVLARLRAMKDVDYVEANQVVRISDVQKNPPNWGLDRITLRDLPLSGEYPHPSHAGTGVDVYVIDTGINIKHEDFGGRAIWGLTAPNGDEDRDGNGHGTHVASTIGGKLHGVAKNSTLIAVKVLRSNGYGSMADVLKGVDWAASEHKRKVAASDNKPVKSVANMSLGGGKSIALNNAIEAAIESGVLFAVAAGNDNKNACDYSPAGAESAITVGATNRRDTRSYFSNYGECVDIFAPGQDITAAWIGGTDEVKTISGTSMASPHVAGVLALLVAEHDLSPSDLKTKVIELASSEKISNPGAKSPNKLLYIPPPENPSKEPVLNFQN